MVFCSVYLCICSQNFIVLKSVTDSVSWCTSRDANGSKKDVIQTETQKRVEGMAKSLQNKHIFKLYLLFELGKNFTKFFGLSRWEVRVFS